MICYIYMLYNINVVMLYNNYNLDSYISFWNIDCIKYMLLWKSNTTRISYTYYIPQIVHKYHYNKIYIIIYEIMNIQQHTFWSLRNNHIYNREYCKVYTIIYIYHNKEREIISYNVVYTHMPISGTFLNNIKCKRI